MGPDPVHQVDSKVKETDDGIRPGEKPSEWIARITADAAADS